MPKPFPGVNGCVADELPSFVCLDGLPPEWHALVTQSKPLSRAIHAATQLPTIPEDDEVTRQVQFDQMDFAELAAANVITTIQRIRAWSKSNLKPEPTAHKAETPAHASHSRKH